MLTKQNIDWVYGGTQLEYVNCVPFDLTQAVFTTIGSCGAVASVGNLLGGVFVATVGFAVCFGYKSSEIYYRYNKGYVLIYDGELHLIKN